MSHKILSSADMFSFMAQLFLRYQPTTKETQIYVSEYRLAHMFYLIIQ
jgi:hypothetical protein